MAKTKGSLPMGTSQEKILPDNNRSYRMEIFSAAVASLSMITTSYTICWIGPALLAFSRPESYIPITPAESAVLSSLFQWGCLPGQLISIFLNNYFGRRNTILLTSIPFLIANAILFASQEISFLYMSRLLNGFGGGIVYASLSVYLSEISTAEIRGVVGLFFQIANCIGEVSLYIIVPYTSISTGCIVSSIPVLLIMFGGFLIPESPYFYLLKKNEPKAKEALSVLRCTPNVDDELHLMSKHLQEKDSNLSFTTLWTDKSYRKSFLIVLLIFFTQQFGGGPGINTYGQILLDEAPTFVSAEMGGLISTVAHVIAVIFTCLTIDNYGRRPLILLSAWLSAIPLGLIAFYFTLKEADVSFYQHINWLPVACLIVYKLVLTPGLNGCCYVVMGEIFPAHLRGYCGSIVSLYGSILGICGISFHAFILAHFGQQYVFAMYTLVCVCCGSILYITLPETKKQRLEDIQAKIKQNDEEIVKY